METIRLVYPVEGGDLIEAGEASSKMKLTLKKLGLPNMKRYSDEMTIDTEVGKGTTVTVKIKIPQ